MPSTDWVETDTQDNAVATATRAADTGREHFCTCVIASYTGNQGGELTVSAGGATLFVVDVFDELDIEFTYPVRAGEGNAISAALDASGAGSTLGHVTIMGYTT